ncbi:hypothetical protein QF037_004544 [Streptomyces canus]|uniref:hypothetical protein n=1 Tax=Streptomyces canus TaxID=58343 RepID=UPI00277E08E3|nr:hypothetical protein [Streptomyces canus]MDQ0600199.1 hypothetical protein [Streptomyces canus]
MGTYRILPAVVASVVVFVLGGCGSGEEGAGVPTVDGGTGVSASQSAGDDVAAYVQARREYVKCLRENGIDAPDPDAKGNIDFGGADILRALKKDPKFLTATQKCGKDLPAVPESIEKGNQPSLSAEQIEVEREYAACMQKNGAADFPDPGPDGLGQGEWDQTSAGAKRATRICGPIIGVPATPGPGKG